MALILALIVTTLLSIIVIEFVYTTSIDLKQAVRYRDDAQVKLAVNSGLVFAETILRYDKTRGDDRSFDSLDDIWNTAVIPTGVGGASMNLTITDEAAKLNLLNLMHSDEEWAERWKDTFVRLCEDVREGMDGEDYETIAEDIVDYMREEKNFNSEDEEDIWSGFPLLSIDELIGVGDITKAFLYGNADEEETGKAAVGGMWDFLTIHSRGAVNINTVSVELVHALSEHITDQLARDVISRREELDENGEKKQIYRGKTQLLEVEGMDLQVDPADPESPTIYASIADMITTRTSFFLVELEVDMGDDVNHVFRAYYKRVGGRLFRLSLADVQPERRPLEPMGVEMDSLGF